MGERKVLNKYYPPDFDPSIIPPKARDKLNTMKVRMMLPFSLRCTSCGEYMYRGKKFNSKKEDVPEERYLGIMVFRFYVNCIRCNALVSFKTDPQNSDYVCEHGASRNFEPWRAKADAEIEATEHQEKQEEVDAMNRLERVTKESKRELDILDALDEVKMMNAANNNISVDQLLNNLKENDEETVQNAAQKQEEVDKATAQAAFAAAVKRPTVRRVEDSEQSNVKAQSKPADSNTVNSAVASSVWGKTLLKQQAPPAPIVGPKTARRGLIGIKRKSDTMAAPEPAKEAVPTPEAVPSTVLRGLLTGYSSSSSQGSTK